jgi:hypothetical protein
MIELLAIKNSCEKVHNASRIDRILRPARRVGAHWARLQASVLASAVGGGGGGLPRVRYKYVRDNAPYMIK